MKNQRDNIAGILLAGGQSRRMGGGDKTLRDLHGRPLLDHVIERIAPQLSDLALNANGNAERFAKWQLPVEPDSISDYPGPLVGILAGLDWAAREPAKFTHILSIPTDTPFIPYDLVAGLCRALEMSPAPLACAASRARLHPVVGLWPLTLRDQLRRAIETNTRKVDSWTARYGISVAHFDDPSGDPFFNINTEDDLAAAKRRLDRL